MTQRSDPTTQSKLTVQAPAVGNGVPGKFAILGSVAGFARPMLSPVFGVGSLNGSLLSAYVKDVALCDTASRAWNQRNQDV
ncbi:hypothetical protein E4K67_02500 [Desulfosporosinus fructosivorans]|uniref:Uncharacterized protein n=1 Tax=Desulfosporosinus fructosivorans TaxID=2018669 RepID=A0A4Z0REA0_9FIRM|nr:hypothetical protein E4K67_02500 [Desulfosporosinus fructosivorans]